MADICIFYSDPDRDKVESLSAIFEALGWTTWWAKKITSGRWGPEIEKNIGISKCVIVIWNSRAIKADSITYAEAERARQLHTPIITLISEDVTPPLPFNADHITANLSQWDGDVSADCISEIEAGLEFNLGIAPKKWEGERPDRINLQGKIVKLPCFVKSISSFETQLDPEAALFTLKVFPKVDALLVSAYDMYLAGRERSSKEKISKHRLICDDLKELDAAGTFIMMDSGNYEKSRKDDDSWSENKFNWVLDNVPFSYAFCFDNLHPSADIVENVNDVISRMGGDHADSLIPILHAPENEDERRIHAQLPDIFYEYASRKKSPIIAVPERELGEGIREKAETVIKIRNKLDTLGWYQPIHILGTGNPLSILILSAAGADFFDGLEWCRTVVNRDNGFLFHHQQFDFFKDQSKDSARFQLVRDEMDKPETSLILKMGLHNLDFFYVWMEDLQEAIHLRNDVGGMLAYHSVFNTQSFINELRKLMPGLFK